MNIRYYLGLDMGTNSVGWAVTNDKYELIRKKGKDLWGIREFDEASPAVERRTNRIARRRRAKEVVRQGYVKNYFSDAIEQVDYNFFARLENSKYHIEDKDENVRYKYGIFNDDNYTDVDYYKEYPTIFHLRKELIENKNAPYDVRLVYLAIANMFKHRGHFLNESLSDSANSRSVGTIYNELRAVLSEVEDEARVLPETDVEVMAEILSNRDISRSAKVESILGLLGIDKKDKSLVEILKCICGLKSEVSKLFSGLELEEKVDICFNDFSYEDKIPDIMAAVGDENYQIVELMKELYDAGVLSAILKGNDYISIARVEEYEKHKSDLKMLKAVIRRHCSEDVYNEMFRSADAGSYGAYVNSYNSGEKQRRDMGGNPARNQEAFYKKVKNCLKSCPEDEDIIYIIHEIENETFMPKQLTAANGVIPNQVHARELKVILSNAENYLPFLLEKDESGYTVSERIIKLYMFHVPYYIGPVTENSERHGGNGWVVRKEAGAVLPWNFEDKIDVDATSERFITNLIRECTYLHGEKVMPKASLAYEAFCVLNEINNLRIDGERISVELKQSIYRDLFQRGKRVTKKQLCNYLQGKGVLNDEAQLTGIDININNSLSSYGKFKGVFGDAIDTDSCQHMVERIIYLGTVYGDSKQRFKACIEKEFSEKLTEGQLKRITGFKFKDWAKFSANFLNLEGANVETGEIQSLIRAIWNSQYNLMEILNSEKYTFKDELSARKQTAIESLSEFSYDDLNDYYFSAPVKRMMWQTILVIREITEIMGCEPERIFIEMTRSEGEKGDKGRKDSRKKDLLELYRNVKDDLHNWKDIIEDADSTGKLRSKKMYLYLRQMGRDMYTGEPINLQQLFSDNVYDIDHIYPRSFVKDDNINNNLVLVNKALNNRKQNYYPINSEIRSNPKVRELWYSLHNLKLINDEKYKRLTGASEFTEEQMAGFIARQLVETSQATKGVADILKIICGNSTIVYSKGNNVSEFRKEYGFIKSRTVNDFHHANDAYLNIVVGNAYFVKFTNAPINFIKKEYSKDKNKYRYHLGKMFEKDIERNGEIAWIAEKDGVPGTIRNVKKVMEKNSPLMTRMSFEGHGVLFNVNPIAKKYAKIDNYAPLKGRNDSLEDVKKYGGYNSLKPAYFIFIEYKSKGKIKKAFDVVPLLYKSRIHNNEDLIKYCEEVLNYEAVRIIAAKIKKNSLIKLNGYYMYIVGLDSRKNVEFSSAVNMCLKTKYILYIKKMDKYLENTNYYDEEITEEHNISLYDELTQKHLYSIFSKSPKPIGEYLKAGREKFISLSLDEQVRLLHDMVQVTAIGGLNISLKKIGGPASDVGRIRISGNMTSQKELMLINQSVTGIWQESINLLTV